MCSFYKIDQGAQSTAYPPDGATHCVSFSTIRTMTVGSGITPDLLTLSNSERRSRAYGITTYRRWGITPRPENPPQHMGVRKANQFHSTLSRAFLSGYHRCRRSGPDLDVSKLALNQKPAPAHSSAKAARTATATETSPAATFAPKFAIRARISPSFRRANNPSRTSSSNQCRACSVRLARQ